MSSNVSLTDLFPAANAAELQAIGDFLHGYSETIWQIYERLEREHPDVIDGLLKSRTMKAKVDSSTNTN